MSHLIFTQNKMFVIKCLSSKQTHVFFSKYSTLADAHIHVRVFTSMNTRMQLYPYEHF
jgi:hypothetical protein